MVKVLIAAATLLGFVLGLSGNAVGQSFGISTTPATHNILGDELDTLADSLAAGTWQKMHEETGQSRGIGSIVLAKTPENWLLPEYLSDWGTGSFWVQHERGKIRAWNGGQLVDKRGLGHSRFYIMAAGGHFDGMDNGVFTFDLLDAARAINAGSRQGTEQYWVKAKEGAIIVNVRDTNGDPNRPFNASHPYDANEQAVAEGSPQFIQWQVWDRSDPTGTDQCNVGPPATHTYGGLAYIPEYDGILNYGHSRGGNVGGGPRGFWMWDIQTQDWQLLPPDRDLIPPFDCSGATAGDMIWEELYATSKNNAGIIPYAPDRIWFGNRFRSYRWRMDDVDWTVNPEAAPNGHAQRTGNYTGHPTKTIANHQGSEERPIGAPYSGGQAAWIFMEDEGVGTGDTGFAIIWPNINNDDNTNENSTYVDYDNYIPGNGVYHFPDLTSGIYSATHQLIFFIHKPWVADFKGQVYAFDPSTRRWSLYIDPPVDPSNPSQAVDNADGGSDNGTWGRFAYMEDRNLFLLVYDAGAASTGYVGQVYLLKGI